MNLERKLGKNTLNRKKILRDGVCDDRKKMFDSLLHMKTTAIVTEREKNVEDVKTRLRDIKVMNCAELSKPSQQCVGGG